MGKGILRGYYSINLLPLGGFVRLKGEHDQDKTRGSFGQASLKSKLKIIYAGVALNFIVAIAMLTIVAWLGMPQLVDNQFNIKSDSKVVSSKLIVNFVEEGSPAQKAGLKNGDVILGVNGQLVAKQTELKKITKPNAGQTVVINYQRDGNSYTTKAKLLTEAEVNQSQNTSNPKAYLGIGSTTFELVRSTWSAPIVAIGDTVQFTLLTFKGLGSALANLGKSLVSVVTGNTTQAKQDASAASENVSGPVGIYFILKQGSTLGVQFILFVIAIISLTLAIINALPIPALDGGRAFVILLFRALKKPLKPSTEDLIHGSGFAALMLLFVLITVVDVKRFF
jgi:regulator of sigma E protease